MNKMGFTRADAIMVLNALNEDLDPEDQQDYSNMSNDELESELCLSGMIHDEYMAGVFDDLPTGMVNARVQAENVTGWPPTLAMATVPTPPPTDDMTTEDMTPPKPPTARERGMKFEREQALLREFLEQGAMDGYIVGCMAVDYITRNELYAPNAPFNRGPFSEDEFNTLMRSCQNMGWLRLDPKISGRNWDTGLILSLSGYNFAKTGDDPFLDSYIPPAEDEPDFHPMPDITVVKVV